jgi:hypothetical protein
MFLKMKGLELEGDYLGMFNIEYMLWIQAKWNKFHAVAGPTINHPAFDQWLESTLETDA